MEVASARGSNAGPELVGATRDRTTTEQTGVESNDTSLLPDDSKLITPDNWMSRMEMSVVRKLSFQAKVRTFITSLEVQIFITLVVTADFASFLAFSVLYADGDLDDATEDKFEIAQWVVIAICLAESAARLFGFGFHVYCKDPWNIVDSSIIMLAIVVASQFVAARIAKVLRLYKGSRVVTFIVWSVRVCRLIIQGRKVSLAVKHRVSQNKARYVDLAGNFDLDLTYITTNLIAMSVPTDKCLMGCYRNGLSDVVRFFRTKHPNNFRIYNACPEHPYPETGFVKAGGNVKHFQIQDHTPPTMNQFVEFLRDANELRMDLPSAVIAVHCKGGKGRTGSLVCAWLLYAKTLTPDLALRRFARNRTRTDKFVADHKLCGVETPSQVRYIHQLYHYLATTGCGWGSDCPPAPLTTPAQVTLKAIHFEDGLIAHPEIMGRLKVLVQCGGTCISDLVLETDYFDADATSVPLKDAIVSGDVRISVFSEKRLKGKSALAAISAARSAYDAKATVLFWVVHTDFLELTVNVSNTTPAPEPGKFRVAVEDLDKAHKNVEKGTHAAGSSVVLRYEKIGDEESIAF